MIENKSRADYAKDLLKGEKTKKCKRPRETYIKRQKVSTKYLGLHHTSCKKQNYMY